METQKCRGPNLRKKSTDSGAAYSIFLLPPASVSFRCLPSASVSGHTWSVWMMETCLGARVVMSGGHIRTPNRPWPNFWRKSTASSAVYAIFMLPSASVCFRLLPPSSVGVRFGSPLARASDGNMFGRHDVDVGRAYLGNQQALCQICGENRPILVLFLPF